MCSNHFNEISFHHVFFVIIPFLNSSYRKHRIFKNRTRNVSIRNSWNLLSMAGDCSRSTEKKIPFRYQTAAFFVNISSEWTRNNVKLDKMRRMHAVNKNGKYPRGKCQQWKNLRRLLRYFYISLTPLLLLYLTNILTKIKIVKLAYFICLCVCVCSALYCDFQFHCEYFNKQLSFLFTPNS